MLLRYRPKKKKKKKKKNIFRSEIHKIITSI